MSVSLLLAVIFVFGAIIGSFLNVVILRINTGKPIIKGRSFCPSCSKILAWYELIPIISFIVQRARCRKCFSKLSLQYLFVEAATAFLFVGVFWKVGLDWAPLTFYWVIFSFLVVIFTYDIRHRIIPDKIVYPFVILSFLYGLISGISIINILIAGSVLAAPFALIWLFSKGRLMGFGDAKFALGMGFLLGLSAGFAALILSFWIGAIVSLVLMAISQFGQLRILGKRFTMKSEVPFAPFLILGTLISFFWGFNMWSLISLFQ